jgi:hypothetical protein
MPPTWIVLEWQAVQNRLSMVRRVQRLKFEELVTFAFRPGVQEPVRHRLMNR